MTQDQLQEILEAYGTEEGERLMVVVPSARVSSGEVLEALQRSGVESRALGAGSARVVDQEGRRYRVTGAYVGAVAAEDASRAEKIARLCGVTMVIFD
jgi:hypothetical protein